MAKHPVPKKKVSQARTAMRYGAFRTKKRKKIEHFVHLSFCTGCGASRLISQACPACGAFRERTVQKKGGAGTKIATIKA